MLNIVVPMAGLGSRFSKAGYTTPKPLIPIHGVAMIQVVIENIRPKGDHTFIFICQRAHAQEFDLANKLSDWAPGCKLIQLDGVTEGAACTVLRARSEIDTATPLMIANSDQYVDIEIDAYLADIDARHLDGLIMTMDADDPKWSFAGVDERGLVTRVVEKQAISRHATVGIYNFRSGAEFVSAADTMISKNLRVNNEFYVAPVYNEMIAYGARVGTHAIGAEGRGMYGLGIPTDLDAFLALSVSRRAVEGIR